MSNPTPNLTGNNDDFEKTDFCYAVKGKHVKGCFSQFAGWTKTTYVAVSGD